MCSFYAYVYVFYDFTFCLSVLFSVFCKHVVLSGVNKLTYLLTIIAGRSLLRSRDDHKHRDAVNRMTDPSSVECLSLRQTQYIGVKDCPQSSPDLLSA